MYVDFKYNDPSLVINDPSLAQDLYVTRSKYFDKHVRSKDVFYELFGESILFDRSSEIWAQKRKHLSVAFYKDKMTQMLKSIITITTDHTQKWKTQFADKDIEMSISDNVKHLVMECIETCVFGKENANETFEITENGVSHKITPSMYLRKAFSQCFSRTYARPRLIFPDLLKYYGMTNYDKNLRKNIGSFKGYIRSLIQKRKKEMEKAGWQSKGDFLSILLQDELFKDNEEVMIDECITFMFAATQTTSILIDNAIYFLTRYKEPA